MEGLLLEVVGPGDVATLVVRGDLGQLGRGHVRLKGLLEGDDVEVELVTLVLMLIELHVDFV